MAVDAGASWTVSPVAAVSGRDEFDRTAFIPYGDRECSWRLAYRTYAPHGGRSQLSRQRRALVTCVLVRVLRRKELPIYAVIVHSCSSRITTACGSEYMPARRSRNDYFRTHNILCVALSGS